MLTRFFNHLKTYRFIYLFNLGLLISGFVFGCFIFTKQDSASLDSLNELIRTVLSVDYIKDPAMIQNNLASNIFLVFTVFFLGVSLAGIPLLAFILFTKGLQVGFSCMLYIEVYALKGIAGILLTLIPFVLFELIAFLILCAVAYEVSLSVWMTSFIKKQTLSLKSVLNHFLNYILIALALIFISTLFKIYLLPLFYQFFSF